MAASEERQWFFQLTFFCDLSWRSSGVFIVNLEPDIMFSSSVFTIEFEKVMPAELLRI